MADRPLPRDVWTGNPEDFNAGGRDNVDVEIIKARFAPDHYRNKTKHFCFFRVIYRTLEDTPEEFTELYRVGFLNSALPTNSSPDTPKDEREPAGGDDSVYNQLAEGLVQLEENEIEEYEGSYLMGKPQKGDDFLVWLSALIECGFQPSGDPSVAQFEGLQLHLDRGKGNTYKDKESGEEKASSILLPSAILGSTAKTTAGKGKTSSASAAKSSAKTETKTTAAVTSGSKSASKSNGNGNGAAMESVAEAIREIIETDGSDGEISKGVCIVKLTKKDQFKSLSASDRKAVTDAFNDDSLFSPARGLIYDADDDMIRTL